ncbi:MAG TPA: selenocysteine-specific translation elongation factor [Gemmatimonadaceae bacterium]|nr:selenocysteine-specific translation elongation factor [Gemmatimonadaceae bacterium]
MILGTAGHIDHGKTALVRALTGVDTDRLPEEKRRGITIDLGFAPLRLDGVGTLGVVDVPGHEAFVRTMVAGATGIDLALLVVAADEGVMPQTREHLAILRLLGVRAGVVALSKIDLVDDEWLALVRDDVRAALSEGSLADAEIVPVSSVTGEGLPELREALRRVARAVPARGVEDLFRMPVDRAFTIRGTGTVVTGTVWSGTLVRDATMRLYPSGETVRARSLQAHGHTVERIAAGERAAVALAGVELSRVGRGAVLVSGEAWRPSAVMRADVALLEAPTRSIGPRSRLRLHLGTSDVGARVVALDGALEPGVTRPARVVLEESIVARAGDRFVLRGGSPVGTVGGGVITDPLAPVRSRALTLVGEGPGAALGRFLDEAGAAGVDVAHLPIRLGVAAPALDALLQGAGAWRVGARVYLPSARNAIERQLLETLGEHHAANPLSEGASRQWLRTRVRAAEAAVDAVLDDLVRAGRVATVQGDVRLAHHAPRLTDRQRTIGDDIRERVVAAGSEPPSLDELAGMLGRPVEELAAICRVLTREGSLVAVEANRHYAPTSVTHLRSLLSAGMKPGVDYGPAELRDLLGVTRKFLIPFLEYCDREGYTIRNELGRRKRGTELAGG